MFKYTQTIGRQQQTNCLSVIDHFVVLAFKGLIIVQKNESDTIIFSKYHYINITNIPDVYHIDIW